MPWVILAVALCVLVWFWPRNALIGLAVVGMAGALIGAAFWGYGVYGERQRDLSPSPWSPPPRRPRGRLPAFRAVRASCSSPSRTEAGRR